MKKALLAIALTAISLTVGCGNRNAAGNQGASVVDRVAYVLSDSEGELQIIDLKTYRILRRVKTGHAPNAMAISPDGRQLLVADKLTGTVTAYYRQDNSTLQDLGTVGVGADPVAITYHPTLGEAYVTASGTGTFTVLNVSNPRTRPLVAGAFALNSPTQAEKVSPGPLDVSEDGNRVYVGDTQSGRLYTLQRTGGTTFSLSTTAPLETSGKVSISAVAVGKENQVYIANRNASELIVYDTSTQTLKAPISLTDSVTGPQVAGPAAIGLNRDKTKAYVANSLAGTVAVVNLTNNTLVGNVDVKRDAHLPSAIAVNGLGDRVYVANRSGQSLSMLNANPAPDQPAVFDTSAGFDSSAGNVSPISAIVLID